MKSAPCKVPSPLRQFASSNLLRRPGVDPRGAEQICGARDYWSNAPTITTAMKLTVPLITILASSCVATLSNGCSGGPTKESTGEYMDNTMITSKVKSAYMQDPVVKGGDVSVESFKGTVMLSGFVDTPEQKARAEEIAAKITGVVAVTNNLQVKNPAGTQATPATTPTTSTTPAARTTTPPATTDPAKTSPETVTPPPAP